MKKITSNTISTHIYIFFFKTGPQNKTIFTYKTKSFDSYFPQKIVSGIAIHFLKDLTDNGGYSSKLQIHSLHIVQEFWSLRFLFNYL